MPDISRFLEIENKTMQEYSYIKKARYLKDNKIFCLFEDGNTRVRKLDTYIQKGGVFSYLKEEANVKKFQIVEGVITWKDAEIDIAPETVYHHATAKPLPKWAIQY
jgi:hypothetical protein